MRYALSRVGISRARRKCGLTVHRSVIRQTCDAFLDANEGVGEALAGGADKQGRRPKKRVPVLFICKAAIALGHNIYPCLWGMA